MTYLHGVCN